MVASSVEEQQQAPSERAKDGPRRRRHLTVAYEDPFSFWTDFRETQRTGVLLLRPPFADGAPALECRIDISVPRFGRFGPLEGQVVRELEGGAFAVRILELPDRLSAALQELSAWVERTKEWLVSTGGVAEPRAGAAPIRTNATTPPTRTRRLTLTGEAAVIATIGVRSGDLSDTSFERALLELESEAAVGVLTLEYADGVCRRGFWRRGGPVGWQSRPLKEEEVLGMLLYRSKRITKEQLSESIELMNELGVRQGEALAEIGAIEHAEIPLLLQAQAKSILGRVLNNRVGTWSFTPVDELEEEFGGVAVRVGPIVFRRARDQIQQRTATALAEQLRPVLDRFPSVKLPAERLGRDLKLGAPEKRFLNLLEGGSRRVRELFAVSHLARSGTASLLVTLVELGLVDLGQAPAAERRTEDLVPLLRARRQQVGKGTLFDHLGVHWLCTRDDIEAAWLGFLRRYAPDRLPTFGPGAEADWKIVYEATQSAYEQLKDDDKRRAYRGQVIERELLRQSVMALTTRAEMANMRGQFAEAASSYSAALEIAPGREDLEAARERALAMTR
jgi:hypothetical protein